MSVQDRLAAAEAEIRAIREEHEESQAQPEQVDIASNPEVRQAAEALARAIAKAQGVDLPLAEAEGSTPAVLELPEEFTKYGGVGVGIMVAAPTEAARQA